MYKQPYPNLQKPIKLRNLLVKNRMMSAPNMLFRTIDGRPDEYYVRYLEHKARGGAGIVTLGEANVCDGGNHTPGMETTQENMAIYAEMSQAIHEHGAAAAVELTHGGNRVRADFNKDPNKIMGPSDTVNPMTGTKIRAMTKEDMEYVADGFAKTAAYYYHAGFDIVHVHCGHGWLLTQFLSPIINKRTDEYGGSLENRMRFPLYVLKKIREHVGNHRTITIRLSGSERDPAGFTVEDSIEFLVKAQEYIDMAEISTEDFRYIFASPYMPHGQNVFLAETIKKSGRVNIPIFTIGSIVDPDQAEEIIASGAADGVSMSRALIADPFFPKKTILGRAEDITPCLRCSNCTNGDNANRHFRCSVNPLTAHELRHGFGDGIEEALHKRNVLIVGGGPAGMQAAITASERGHRVTLVERGPALGGLLRFTETDTIKHDLRRFTEYLIRKVHRSSATIMLNTVVTDDLVERLNPGHIIIATGSVPIIPAIKGVEKARYAADVYFHADFSLGENIVIIGGGPIGVETGLHLMNLGKKVTVLELTNDIARDSSGLVGIMDAIQEKGMNVLTGAKTLEITDTGVVYEKDGQTATAPADAVLYAVGMRPDERTYFELYDRAPFVINIGDAKQPGKVDNAINGGFFAAMSI
ncbi:MAG: FAD-dependent oxidoreductase [Oscillospiraceae bacterium]|nr:FAD-dependent oxidoreductase [Oscillospiraceae bacterium]